jgi:acyl-CoA synthetase (AMP-forming)/AMP-acid ligase II
MTDRLLQWRDSPVASAILSRAATSSSRAVLNTSFGQFTGDKLCTSVTDIADSLRSLHLDTDAPLIIVMAGDPWTVAALLAADLVGRTAVLLRAPSTGAEIRSAVTASGAELLLQFAEAQIHEAEDGSSSDIRHGLSWKHLRVNTKFATTARLSRRARDGFVCHQTSGTAGSSRLALRTGSSVLTEMEMIRRVLTMTDQDRVLCGSAVSHSYGCIGGLLAPLLAGAAVTIARNTEEARVAVAELGPTIIFGLGPMYGRLADSASSLSHDLANVRFAFSAGAPLGAGLFERFRERFGTPIRQDYGTTETGTISLDLKDEPRPDSVGFPLPHVEVRLRPPEAIPLKPGEEGEILVRSPALALGYLVDGKLVPCVDEEGWYSTQDAGSWVDHRLLLHRRLRALPSVNGESIDLDAVESVIGSMPGVVEVVVRADAQQGRIELVAIVATRVYAVDEIRLWCAQRLPRNWVPERIVTCDRLPRSPAGKVLNKYP